MVAHIPEAYVLFLRGYALFIDNYLTITQMSVALAAAERDRHRMKSMPFCGPVKPTLNGIDALKFFSKQEIVGAI